MTRIALIGYGAMGRELEALAHAHGCEVTAIFDVDRPLTTSSEASFDVAIDFSLPDAVVNNVRTLAHLQRPVVIGTTGWYAQLPDVSSIVTSSGIGCVWGSNFSVGVQMFLRIVRAAAALANDAPEYDVMVHEWHHHRKKDSPSGTAIASASTIVDAMDRKHSMEIETQHDRVNPYALHVTSTRGGEVVGRHVVTMDSVYDTIDLVHNAKNRSGFAQGALLAAKWVVGRKGIVDFTDIFPEVQAFARSSS
jgi:4-hydroxy-tetrahydrodipicolinate reductase